MTTLAPATARSWFSRLKRWLGWPLVVLIFWFWWRSLERLAVDWTGVMAQTRGAEGLLLLSIVGGITYLLLQAATWRHIVAALGPPLPWVPALRLWMLSNFARYLPGSVWHLVGRIYLGADAGVRRASGTLGILLEQGLQLLAALVLLALTLPFWGMDAWGFVWAVLLVPVGLVSLHPRFFVPLVNAALTAARQAPLAASPRYRDLLAYIGLYMLAHFANGLALVFAVVALGGLWTKAPVIIGAGMAAWSIGFVSILTPGGLGLREGVVTLLLAPTVGVDVAAAGAVLWRAANILTEALCVVVLNSQGRQTGLTGKERISVSSAQQ